MQPGNTHTHNGVNYDEAIRLLTSVLYGGWVNNIRSDLIFGILAPLCSILEIELDRIRIKGRLEEGIKELTLKTIAERRGDESDEGKLFARLTNPLHLMSSDNPLPVGNAAVDPRMAPSIGLALAESNSTSQAPNDCLKTTIHWAKIKTPSMLSEEQKNPVHKNYVLELLTYIFVNSLEDFHTVFHFDFLTVFHLLAISCVQQNIVLGEIVEYQDSQPMSLKDIVQKKINEAKDQQQKKQLENYLEILKEAARHHSNLVFKPPVQEQKMDVDSGSSDSKAVFSSPVKSFSGMMTMTPAKKGANLTESKLQPKAEITPDKDGRFWSLLSHDEIVQRLTAYAEKRRGTSRAMNNCPYNAADAVFFLETRTVPEDKIYTRKNCKDYILQSISVNEIILRSPLINGYLVIKGKQTIDASIKVPQDSRIVPRPAGSDSGEFYSNRLEYFRIKEELTKEAEKQGGEFWGRMDFCRIGENKQGHCIAFLATTEHVYGVCLQSLVKGELKPGKKLVFWDDEFAKNFTFIGLDGRYKPNAFGLYCFWYIDGSPKMSKSQAAVQQQSSSSNSNNSSSNNHSNSMTLR